MPLLFIQDPILFSGTVRYNLDPLKHRTDVELWNALEKVRICRITFILCTILDFFMFVRYMCSQEFVISCVELFQMNYYYYYHSATYRVRVH